MSEIFEMLSAIARRRSKAQSGSPFCSVKRAEKWLAALPTTSDYDTHHALVEGIERFNADHDEPSLGRMKVLLKLEEAGLPLQARIVEQYARNQSTFRLARQALWRESWAFWSMLAEAWLRMLKAAYRGDAIAELRPHRAAIAARAIRYAGLAMRWNYHQAHHPVGSAWRRVHKLYRLAERDGYETETVTIESLATSAAREYAQIVLMGLVQPIGYRAQDIEAIADMLERSDSLPLPTKLPERGVHTHVVDLSFSEGAALLEADWVQGRRLRYFALAPLVAELRAFTPGTAGELEEDLNRQVASLIERGGVRRGRQRTHREGELWVAAGMSNILAALAHPAPTDARPALETWTLRDESPEGVGFALAERADLPHGRLVAVSWDPAENVWQLLAIRWNRAEGGHHLVGAQRLSRHPKRLEIMVDDAASGGASDAAWAVFLPMTHAEAGVSNLLLPLAHYQLGAMLTLRDGDLVYRLRLGEIHESHEGWLRVGMEVVEREQLAAAA